MKGFVSVKHRGRSLIELMLVLFIFILTSGIIVNIYTNTMRNYFASRKVDGSEIALYEALSYMDSHLNFSGERYYIKDSRLYTEFNDGKLKNYFYLSNSDLRVAYSNDYGSSYTSQPLLYDVKEFNLSKNNKVIFVEIITLEGIKMKRAIGKI